MSKRMLIDASHPEETRVVILSGNRVEEFDFESASRKPLKGNIFLAKVTRVEPSLQAAFVEYGGNRHGFLAFNEIHPDYYQIPVADRQALLAAQRADERSTRHSDDDADAPAAAETAVPEATVADDPMPVQAEPSTGDDATPTGFDTPLATTTDEATQAQLDAPTAPQALIETEITPPAEPATPSEAAPASDAASTEPVAAPSLGETAAAEAVEANGEDSQVEEIAVEEGSAETEIVSGGDDDDVEDEQPRRSHRMMRHYKIQEVIKKRQIILIQVVKEERGNKGAALTTYLSLAGRYCVLMPNSGRGGGISRKITNSSDRRRLKEAAESLDVPEGMGLIVRTAGASRTKQEIQRDYEYLLRLWDSIRDLTLRSSAPALVYEEGNLIKRAIRDQFSRDIEEIVVEGAQGFEEAQTFTKMLMPQHADAVKLHDGHPPLFQKYRVESQLDSMFNPRVQLKSGGYIVINQTEALVAIDVNSGRSTREHNIEDTAHKTNLEAAEEVARQLRLRDLAGLIVIDFIDMEENRNDRAVERRLKECLRHDRARIQLGRISPFGLLEMSRQRLRPGMVEGSTIACPHCNGTGLIRSVESLSLRALRNVEEEAQASRTEGVTLRVPTEVALYILNHKRADVAAMEERLQISIFVDARHDMFGADCDVEIGAPTSFRPRRPAAQAAVSAETALALMPEPSYDEPSEESDGGSNIEMVEDSEGDEETRPAGRSTRGDGRRGRRRGRGRDDRGRDDRNREDRPRAAAPSAEDGADPLPVIGDSEGSAPIEGDEASESTGSLEDLPTARDGARDGNDRRRRRRGRRGGRRNGRPEGGLPTEGDTAESMEADADASDDGEPNGASDEPQDQPAATPSAPKTPKAERKSPAAAIARFFGFGSKSEQRGETSPVEVIPVGEGPVQTSILEAVGPIGTPAEIPAAMPAERPQASEPPAATPEAEPTPAAAASEPIAEVALPQPVSPDTMPVAIEPAAPEVKPGPSTPDEPPTPAYVADVPAEPAPAAEAPATDAPAAEAPAPAEKAPTERRSRSRSAKAAAAEETPATVEEPKPTEPEVQAEPTAPAEATAEPAPPAEPPALKIPEVETSEIVVIGPTGSGPAKAGWWKKK